MFARVCMCLSAYVSLCNCVFARYMKLICLASWFKFEMLEKVRDDKQTCNLFNFPFSFNDCQNSTFLLRTTMNQYDFHFDWWDKLKNHLYLSEVIYFFSVFNPLRYDLWQIGMNIAAYSFLIYNLMKLIACHFGQPAQHRLHTHSSYSVNVTLALSIIVSGFVL